MLYLFTHCTQPWMKFGWTEGCPWVRLYGRGFESCPHDPALCGQLGPECWELRGVWPGGRAE